MEKEIDAENIVLIPTDEYRKLVSDSTKLNILANAVKAEIDKAYTAGKAYWSVDSDLFAAVTGLNEYIKDWEVINKTFTEEVNE